MRVEILFLLLLALTCVYGAAAQGTNYANCSNLGPTPWPKICWDEARAMVRPTSSYMTGSTSLASPFAVSNASFFLPSNWTLRLGYPVAGMGAPNATFDDALLLESGANLGLVGLTLHVGGNLTLQSGARLSISVANTSNASVVVDGCLVIEPNVTLVLSSLDPSLVNASLIFDLFVLRGQCMEGAFGRVNISFVSSASGPAPAPLTADSCGGAQSSVLSFMFNIFCTPPVSPPPPPPPPPPPTYVLVQTGGSVPPTNGSNTPGSASSGIIVWTLVVVPAPSGGNLTTSPDASVTTNGGSVTDQFLLAVISSVLVGLLILAVVGAVVVLKVPAIRSRLFPHRDREFFVPSVQRPHRPRERDPTSGYMEREATPNGVERETEETIATTEMV